MGYFPYLTNPIQSGMTNWYDRLKVDWPIGLATLKGKRGEIFTNGLTNWIFQLWHKNESLCWHTPSWHRVPPLIFGIWHGNCLLFTKLEGFIKLSRGVTNAKGRRRKCDIFVIFLWWRNLSYVGVIWRMVVWGDFPRYARGFGVWQSRIGAILLKTFKDFILVILISFNMVYCRYPQWDGFIPRVHFFPLWEVFWNSYQNAGAIMWCFYSRAPPSNLLKALRL